METKQIIETVINKKAKYFPLVVVPFDSTKPVFFPKPINVDVLKILSYIGSNGELTTYALCLSEDGKMFHSHISQITFDKEGK